MTQKIGVVGAIIIVCIACLVLANGNIALETWANRPTPGPAQLTMTRDGVYLRLTEQAGQILAQRTREAQALRDVQAEGTARAAEKTAESIRAAQTAEAFERGAITRAAELARTAEAAEHQAAATAQAAMTAQAWALQREYWTATAVFIAAESTRQAAHIAVQSTAKSAQTQSARTATAEAYSIAARQRETELAYSQHVANVTATAAARALAFEEKAMMGKAWALFWLVLAASIAVLALAVGWRLVRYRTDITVIPPAVNGDTPLVYRNGYLVDMARSPLPSIRIEVPPQLPMEAQLQVTAGDQASERARALPRSVTIKQAQTANRPGFTVIDSSTTPPAHLLPDEAARGAIDADWRVDE